MSHWIRHNTRCWILIISTFHNIQSRTYDYPYVTGWAGHNVRNMSENQHMVESRLEPTSDFKAIESFLMSLIQAVYVKGDSGEAGLIWPSLKLGFSKGGEQDKNTSGFWLGYFQGPERMSPTQRRNRVLISGRQKLWVRWGPLDYH